jgi:hypothetical protein
MARIVAMTVVVVLAALPAGAMGAAGELTPQPAPTQPLFQNEVQEAPAPAPTPEPELPASAAESRIGPGELALIVLAVALLIGGIWFAISRDARRVTRGRTPQAAGGGGGSPTRAAHRSRKLSSAERRRRKRGKSR